LKKISVYFFCPAYNEEKNLEGFISDTVKAIEEIAEDYLITIVDDGSSDNTEMIIKNLVKKYKKVETIRHKQNMGYGAALITGFTNPKRVNYDFVAYADSDGQIKPEEFKKFVPFLEDYDAVIGYRMDRQDTFYRRFQSLIYNLLNHMFFKLTFKDFNCPFKIFKREILEHMDIEDKSFFIDTEMVVKSVLAGYRVKEVGVVHFPRITGQASGAKIKLILGTIKGMFDFLKKYNSKSLKYRKKEI